MTWLDMSIAEDFTICIIILQIYSAYILLHIKRFWIKTSLAVFQKMDGMYTCLSLVKYEKLQSLFETFW